MINNNVIKKLHSADQLAIITCWISEIGTNLLFSFIIIINNRGVVIYNPLFALLKVVLEFHEKRLHLSGEETILYYVWRKMCHSIQIK